MTSTTSPAQGNPLVRLMRKLSSRSKRSSPSSPPSPSSPDPIEQESTRGRASFSFSPPPDSYFPPPPDSTLISQEASGIARDPASLGARAIQVGGDPSDPVTASSAPGVSFAPSSLTRSRSRGDTKLANAAQAAGETWSPPLARRSPSIKLTRSKSDHTAPPSPSLTVNGRTRALSTSTTTVAPGRPPLPPSPSRVPSYDRTPSPSGAPSISTPNSPSIRTPSRPPPISRASSLVRRTLSHYTLTSKSTATEKRVLVMVADGTEEIEVMTVFDLCVRASMLVTVCSISPFASPSESLGWITLSRGAKLVADVRFDDFKPEWEDEFDAVVIPGGAKGAERLSQNRNLNELVKSFYDSGRLVAMICAGSLVAKSAGIALGERITSHPSVRKELETHYSYSEDRVVVANNLITSRGPGTAMEWGLMIIEILCGESKRREVEAPLMM